MFLQSLPLELKILKTQQRIKEWVSEFGVNGTFISFSGGKDSTVLLHIARKMFPDLEAVYVDTGLEYPEIKQFVKTFKNVTILRPKLRFDEVINKYGYPIISKEVSECVYGARRWIRERGGTPTELKSSSELNAMSLQNPTRGGEIIGTENYVGLENMTVRTARLFGNLTRDNKIMGNIPNKDRSAFSCVKYAPLAFTDFNSSSYCCNVMKKSPVHSYERKTHKVSMTAQMAAESRLRMQQWLKNGCNAFDAKHKISNPMSFWTEEDVLLYARDYIQPELDSLWSKVKYSSGSNRKLARKELKKIGYKTTAIASVYGQIVEKDGHLTTTGTKRTGCIFCAFGAHMEKYNHRFIALSETHPKQYNYCIQGGEYDEDGIWKPNKCGLGMGHVFDELNKIYGEDFIPYKKEETDVQ